MNVLVLSDNSHVLNWSKRIFNIRKKDNHFTFTDSDAINPQIDFKHIIDNYDLVFSLHCKKIFPEALHKNIRCINVHPGYNPYNRGMFPHVWSMVNGKLTGATIHEITGQIDNGPIIARAHVDITPNDTSETLYSRILLKEMELLEIHRDLILEGTYHTFPFTPDGNYNSMEDFKRLCNIDPTEIGTFQQFFDKLRALSHGDYCNAHIGNTYFKLIIKDENQNLSQKHE